MEDSAKYHKRRNNKLRKRDLLLFEFTFIVFNGFISYLLIKQITSLGDWLSSGQIYWIISFVILLGYQSLVGVVLRNKIHNFYDVRERYIAHLAGREENIKLYLRIYDEHYGQFLFSGEG